MMDWESAWQRNHFRLWSKRVDGQLFLLLWVLIASMERRGQDLSDSKHVSRKKTKKQKLKKKSIQAKPRAGVMPVLMLSTWCCEDCKSAFCGPVISIAVEVHRAQGSLEDKAGAWAMKASEFFTSCLE